MTFRLKKLQIFERKFWWRRVRRKERIFGRNLIQNRTPDRRKVLPGTLGGTAGALRKPD